MSPSAWVSRRFELGLPDELFPNLLERLRGTPARLEERVAGLPAASLTRRVGERWSIQENAGHLLELESLLLGRLDDYEAGAPALRAADMTNRATYDAGFNGWPLERILTEFRARRLEAVARLDAMPEPLRRRAPLHPRLAQPMRVVDLMFFIAEHDDHHLACIGELVGRQG